MNNSIMVHIDTKLAKNAKKIASISLIFILLSLIFIAILTGIILSKKIDKNDILELIKLEKLTAPKELISSINVIIKLDKIRGSLLLLSLISLIFTFALSPATYILYIISYASGKEYTKGINWLLFIGIIIPIPIIWFITLIFKIISLSRKIKRMETYANKVTKE